MKFLKYILPHITISLALGAIVIIVLDGYNPMMNFMGSVTTKVYFCLTFAFSALTAVLYSKSSRKR